MALPLHVNGSHTEIFLNERTANYHFCWGYPSSSITIHMNFEKKVLGLGRSINLNKWFIWNIYSILHSPTCPIVGQTIKWAFEYMDHPEHKMGLISEHQLQLWRHLQREWICILDLQQWRPRVRLPLALAWAGEDAKIFSMIILF